MALQLTLDAIDTVPEPFRALYTERDGKFHLAVEKDVRRSKLHILQQLFVYRRHAPEAIHVRGEPLDHFFLLHDRSNQHCVGWEGLFPGALGRKRDNNVAGLRTVDASYVFLGSPRGRGQPKVVKIKSENKKIFGANY